MMANCFCSFLPITLLLLAFNFVSSIPNGNEEHILKELGLDNLASTLASHDWTCVLLYDPWDVAGTNEHTKVLEGVTQNYYLNQNNTSSHIAFGRLDLRRHAMIRDALTGAVTDPDYENGMAQDYYDKVPRLVNDEMVLSNTALLNFALGSPYWPAQLICVGPDFNTYSLLELDLFRGNVPLKISLLEHWILHQTVGQYATYKDAEEILVYQSRSSLEKDIREEYRDGAADSQNSFAWDEYEREQQRLQAAEIAQEESKPGQSQVDVRLMLENESKQDQKTSNNGFFIYRRATVKTVKSASTYLDVLVLIVEEYMAWATGYESTWSPERRVREDQQTNFGYYLQEMNEQLRTLVDNLLGSNSNDDLFQHDPILYQRILTDSKLASRMAIPNLKRYFDELVFGSGKSPQSFQAIIVNMTSTLGSSPEERRRNRSNYDGSEFPIVNALRDYLGVLSEMENDRNRFSLALAELTAGWNNIMRDFHKNLNQYYVQECLGKNDNRKEKGKKTKKKPHRNTFSFRAMDILNMEDPKDHDMLTNYTAFHAKYTATGTPVILSNVKLTPRQNLTLETIVEMCAASDVTSQVQVSRKVGERSAGTGWGGLEDYVLEDSLLDDDRKERAKPQRKKAKVGARYSRRSRDVASPNNADDMEDSIDVGEDEDSDEDDGIDRSITMEQFALLSERIDNLYLHDFTLLDQCDYLLYDHIPYDDKQKFQIPFVIGSYDLFQRLPHSSFASSWPSMFIGRQGSNSKLHVDNGGTGFFMFLVTGRKRWIVYNRDERVHLYERIDKPQTYPDVLGIGKDKKSDEFLSNRFPLLHRAEAAYEIIQEPGQLVYIPPSCPQ